MAFMARPQTAECESCGTTFSIAPKGRIPTRCPDCRDGKSPVQREAEASVTLDHDERGGTQSYVADATFDAPAEEVRDDLVEHELPDVPEPEAVYVGPTDPKVVWDGSNLDEVRKILDEGIEINWHRGNGRPYAEVHGEDRSWFMEVKPGDTVWHDAVIQNR